MTIEAQVIALEGLVAVDEELAQLTQELDKEREELERKRTRLVELVQRLEQGQSSVDAMEKTRGELTQEVRQMSLQIDRSREKMSRCRTEREANAVQRELEELRKLYRDREIEIQKISELVTQAREDMAETDKARVELDAELGAHAGETESKLEGLEATKSAKQAGRQGFITELPGALYRKYELIRKRRGSAVCFTSDGMCSACHIMLAPALFQQLRRGDNFDQCPSCNRILYFKQRDEPADGEADA